MNSPAPDSDDVFVRAFIAVSVNEEVRRQLAEVQRRLKKTYAHVGWVRSENIHLSLLFLGNITHDVVPLVKMAVDQAAGAGRAFSVGVADVGVFGSRRSPRVVWAGVRDAEGLRNVHARLAPLFRDIGLTIEEREFRPHITLGRVRSARGRDDLARAIEALGPVEFGTVDVKDVLLMRSMLRPEGAEHSVLHRAALPA